MLLPFLLFFSQNILQLGERSNIWEKGVPDAFQNRMPYFHVTALAAPLLKKELLLKQEPDAKPCI